MWFSFRVSFPKLWWLSTCFQSDRVPIVWRLQTGDRLKFPTACVSARVSPACWRHTRLGIKPQFTSLGGVELDAMAERRSMHVSGGILGIFGGEPQFITIYVFVTNKCTYLYSSYYIYYSLLPPDFFYLLWIICCVFFVMLEWGKINTNIKIKK